MSLFLEPDPEDSIVSGTSVPPAPGFPYMAKSMFSAPGKEGGPLLGQC